jgi:hypothetical protein
MLYKLKPSEQALKNIINLTFLTLSSFLIVYFLIQLTPNPIIKAGFSVFAVILEVFMQYLLGTGRVRWKGGRRLQACALFFFYGLYVLAYAVPSATGFFMAEISVQEEITARAGLVEDTDRQRLTQINSTIKNLNAQLEAESKSGYGQRSQMIMDELKQLTKEQAAIQKRFKTSPPPKTTGSKDLFQVMGDVFKIPGNVFKLAIFSICVLMVYVGLIMTSWDLSSLKEETVIETAKETPIETAETVMNKKAVCPVCGKHFPFKKEKIYCGSYCRLKAHRQKEAVQDATL